MAQHLLTVIRRTAKALYRNDAEHFVRVLETLHERYVVTLKQRVPHVLIDMLVLAEDRRFWHHFGVDLRSIVRAGWRTVALGRREGGSTLEQQLWRTISGQMEVTIQRKVKELCLATLVGEVVPKRDIPGIYLSVAYFGWKMVGVERACNVLGYSLEHLTLEQAASLVARIKYPEPRRRTVRYEQRLRARMSHILRLHSESRLRGRTTKNAVYSALRDR